MQVVFMGMQTYNWWSRTSNKQNSQLLQLKDCFPFACFAFAAQHAVKLLTEPYFPSEKAGDRSLYIGSLDAFIDL
jgi:hypothetical protein